MTGRLPHITLTILLAVVCLGRPASAQPADVVTGQLKHAGVDERIGEYIALDGVFVNAQGEEVALKDYFDGDRPVVLSFVYHQCPMLCSLVLAGLTNAMRGLDWVPGEEYQVLSVSFAPNETPDMALEQKERYVARLGEPTAAEGWHFLTGQEADLVELANSAGFAYELDPETGEYGHPAVLVIVSPEGMVTRYLYGIEYPVFDFRAALVEASEGRVGSVVDRLIMFCFQYDPVAGSYVPQAWLAMRLAGGVTVLLLATLLTVFWRRERKQSRLNENKIDSSNVV